MSDGIHEFVREPGLCLVENVCTAQHIINKILFISPYWYYDDARITGCFLEVAFPHFVWKVSRNFRVLFRHFVWGISRKINFGYFILIWLQVRKNKKAELQLVYVGRTTSCIIIISDTTLK